MPDLKSLLERTYRGYTGSRGDTGIQGVQGIQGALGPIGYTGSQGVQGIQGLDGAFAGQGIQGIQGIAGEQGSQGIQGLTGIQGIQGIAGSQGISGVQGAAGSVLDLVSQTDFILTYKSLNDTDFKTQSEISSSLKHDSKGNVFVIGYSNISSNTLGSLNTALYVSKIDPSGIVLWTNFYSVVDDINDLTDILNSPTIDVDSSDTPFIMAQIITPSNEYYTEIAKLNKDNGAIVWKRSLRDSTLEVYSSNIVVDNEDNVYAVIYALNEESNYGATIFKYSNSGSLIWAKDLESSVVSSDGSNGYATVDSLNNLIVWVSENMTNNPILSNTVVKLDSNGNILWQKNMSNSGSTNFDRDWNPLGVATDTLDNVYVLGYESQFIISSPSYYLTEIMITKLNTSGVLQWQKKINLPDLAAGTSYPSSLHSDNQNNLYVAIITSPSITGTEEYINVVKISSSGNVLWARKFYDYNPPYGDDQFDTGGIMNSISTFNNKLTFTYVSSALSSNNIVNTYGIVAQFPYDGSATGRYSNYYYLTQDASLTNVSYPLSEGTLQIGNTTVDDSNGTIIAVSFPEPITNDLIVIDSGNVLQGTIVNSIASTNTLNWNSDTYDFYSITAQSSAIVIAADIGNPITGKKVTFKLKDNGTGRSITWTTGVDKGFRAVGVTLPTTTVANKVTYVEALYDQIDKRWDVVNVLQEA